MITPILAGVSFISFLVLMLLGMKLVHEETTRRGNRLFTTYIFWIAGISFCEFMLRMSESVGQATFWAYCAALWPIAGAFLIHSLLLMLRVRQPHVRLLSWLVYPVTIAMSLVYAGFIRSGDALNHHFGYTLVTADILDMPYGLVTIAQTIVLAIVFLLLLRGGWDDRQQFLRRRDLRWITVAFTAYVTIVFGGHLLGLPELTGVSYLALGGIIYLGIRNGYMLVLTPLSASRQILGSISEVLLLTDPEYRVITANYAATIFFGCSEADLIGTQMPLLEDAEGTPSQGELCSDDGSRWIRLRETPIDTRRGILMGRLLIGRDITDEKLRTDLLQRSLAEKESLLREIRHRAYNTLQMIASILHLKSDQLADPDGRRVIAECNARIRAIAAVYEPVWDGEDRSRIELGELVQLQVEEAFGREDAIARDLCLELGSTLKVESTPEGTHAEFSVRVPRVAPPQVT